MSSQWDEEIDEATSVSRFKHALKHALREQLGGSGVKYDHALEQRFAVIHGSPLGSLGDIQLAIDKATTRNAVALLLQHLLDAAAAVPTSYYAITNYIDSVSAAVVEALKHHPGLRMKIASVDERYEVHPTGASELDTSLVERSVDWLARFPAIQGTARRALRALAEGDDREALGNTREMLEMLAKAILANDKSLENQVGSAGGTDAPLLRWLRSRGAKAQTVTMAQRIVSSFCDFQNEWVKHPPVAGAAFLPQEVEYSVYIAFALVRLISSLT